MTHEPQRPSSQSEERVAEQEHREKNLSDENPHPIVEYLFYDHPPIGKRIRMAKRYLHA
jgi:Zn-dependent protease with chaperone function